MVDVDLRFFLPFHAPSIFIFFAPMSRLLLPAITGLALLGVVSLSSSSHAQLRQGVASSSAQLTAQFRDGFIKGCTPGKTQGVSNQIGYCNCLADAYSRRYDGNTLAAISQLAGSLGEKGPALVNVMISPEAKACSAKY